MNKGIRCTDDFKSDAFYSELYRDLAPDAFITLYNY